MPSSLVCTEPARVLRVCGKSLCYEFSTVSVSRQLEPFFLGYGESAVVSVGGIHRFLMVVAGHAFRAHVSKAVDVSGYRAANGSAVNVSGWAEIGVQMLLSDPKASGGANVEKARVKVMVGNIKHNILSITALADSGWRFTQGSKGFSLVQERSELSTLPTALGFGFIRARTFQFQQELCPQRSRNCVQTMWNVTSRCIEDKDMCHTTLIV